MEVVGGEMARDFIASTGPDDYHQNVDCRLADLKPTVALQYFSMFVVNLALW